MKSPFRLGFLIALIALLVITPVASIRAQGGGCPEGLSADDCELLTAATAGTSAANVFQFDYSITLTTEGVPGGDADVSISGEGGVDASKLDAAAMADTTKMLADLLFFMTIDASAKLPPSTDQSGKLELRIVNNELYIKGYDTANPEAWGKVSLTEAMASASSGTTGLPINPTDLTGQMGQMSGLLQSFSALANVPGLITGEATDGPAVEGVETRAISVNLSLSVLVQTLTSEEFRPALKALLAASGQTVPDDQLEQLAGVAQALKGVLDATKISFVVYAGKSDKQLKGFSLIFSTEIDPKDPMLGAALNLTDPLKVNFNFTTTLKKIGESFTVEPVADAKEISTQQ